jgi:hypothetical protein
VVACAKRAQAHSGLLKVVAVPKGKADTLFNVTGLKRVFEVYSDEKSALASFLR